MRRLIIGCGYLGCRVADRWLARGDRVYVLTRSADRAGELSASGMLPLIGDVTDPASLPAFPQVDTTLWAVGHDRQSGKTMGEVYVDGLKNVLAALIGTGRVIYISSTGVYGQQDGSWVDETSPCEPTRTGGRVCLDAEQALLASSWSDRAVILRLAGIYGPQRLPRLRQLRAGQPLRSDPDGVINLIHVDDAATSVLCVAELSLQLPSTYLIADGHPVTRREFYQVLAQQARSDSPVFERDAPHASEMMRTGSHKRVANGRMVDELGVELRYPTYREGLEAVARSEGIGGA